MKQKQSKIKNRSCYSGQFNNKSGGSIMNQDKSNKKNGGLQ